jgi:hypothetical protein
MAPTLLYIVSRDRPALYEHLKRQFAGTGAQVILDRRQGERRRDTRAFGLERRRGDRRTRDVGAELAGVGWAVVDLRKPARRRAARSALTVGDRVVLWRYNPLLPQRLVGRDGIVVEVGRVRALVQFDGEPKQRHVDIGDLRRAAR